MEFVMIGFALCLVFLLALVAVVAHLFDSLKAMQAVAFDARHEAVRAYKLVVQLDSRVSCGLDQVAKALAGARRQRVSQERRLNDQKRVLQGLIKMAKRAVVERASLNLKQAELTRDWLEHEDRMICLEIEMDALQQPKRKPGGQPGNRNAARKRAG